MLLDVPADALGPVLALLGRQRAVPRTTTPRGTSCTPDGEVPRAGCTAGQRPPGPTRGEAVLEHALERYAPLAGNRPAPAAHPLDRKEHLLRVVGRVR
ncbi:hypothetical protein [Streptomyces sp. WMMC940]|uniref:hypothetical protein n=1 Tax=Streptomyces sp. WMMC940 TaxID=3015153 RepID=UPI0022B655CA|nr:hypothetical protein [Streptomyces sp. WMMC940]MCZ7461968.1 hypothetical protein [Streptomyces sp. WMMC940]